MITEELERSVTRTHKTRAAKAHFKFQWRSLLQEFRIGLVVMMFAFLLSSLAYFENQASSSAAKNLRDFDWLVMIKGDQLTVDEAGRFLKQLDGVERVEFYSSEMLIQRMEQDGLPPQDLDLLKAMPLAPAWRVSWNELTNFSKLSSESLPDVKNFPGVVDVAYDADVLKNFQSARTLSLQIKLCQTGLLFLLLLVGLVGLGELLFFTSVSRKQLYAVWPIAVSTFAFWCLAVFWFRGVVGPVSWGLVGEGLLASFLRVVFYLTHRKD